MTTFINSEWFTLEKVLNRSFPEKMNAKSVFVKEIWPKWAPIAQKVAKKGQIPLYSKVCQYGYQIVSTFDKK